MFFTGKSKQLPYLSEYINEANARNQLSSNPDGGWVAAAAVLGALVFVLMRFIGGPALIGGLIMAALVMVAADAWRRYKQKKNPVDPLQRESNEIVKDLAGSLERRRLHRDLDSGGAELLEECARHWRRATDALDSPFWTSPNLPLHWQSVREQAKQAADRAMQEVIVLLADAYQPKPRQPMWQEVIEDVAEQYLNQSPQRRSDSLPLLFEPARKIAEKLKMLAAEVEEATKEVVAEGHQVGHFTSSDAMELCLSELRTIRQAEEELRQDLHGSS
jgi:uncharacterized membrane protein YccC